MWSIMLSHMYLLRRELGDVLKVGETRAKPEHQYILVLDIDLLPPSLTQNHSINMSTAAKMTLLGTTVSAIGIVLFVHRQQKLDQAVSEHHY